MGGWCEKLPRQFGLQDVLAIWRTTWTNECMVGGVQLPKTNCPADGYFQQSLGNYSEGQVGSPIASVAPPDWPETCLKGLHPRRRPEGIQGKIVAVRPPLIGFRKSAIFKGRCKRRSLRYSKLETLWGNPPLWTKFASPCSLPLRRGLHLSGQERLQHCLARVDPDQWASLVAFWGSWEGVVRSKRNSKNHEKERDPLCPTVTDLRNQFLPLKWCRLKHDLICH
ncbi:hypothetical protein MRB53_034277 [Persea americana]|uniref:Uncharacterized protein n=1 Tax=Persea americana TaxID=3435 RepID=A0ACC2KXC9_PERAE|nr:hypothetical protein MRB53_034277 [Persea americana]